MQGSLRAWIKRGGGGVGVVKDLFEPIYARFPEFVGRKIQYGGFMECDESMIFSAKKDSLMPYYLILSLF